MATLNVGANQQYSRIADAISASKDGDVVAVQAGTYVNDFASITRNITLRGVGGVVNMVATVPPPNGKAILTISGNVTVDHFEFSGAKVADRNGAGIRYESGNLTITNSSFHNNENGLLGAADPNGSITIKNSEFASNGVGDGQTHNLYVAAIRQLTVQDSYFHDAVVGHELKSRALNNTITGSRFQNNSSGTASYEIDLPNGGNARIENNVIQQSPSTQNPVMIAFGEEGGAYPGSQLVVRGNTIVNDRNGGVAVWNATSGTATMENNRVFGFSGNARTLGSVGQSGTQVLNSRPVLSTASPTLATPDPVSQTTVVFSLSEEAWRGDAQAYVSVDGQRLGGLQTIAASHALKQTKVLSFVVPLTAGPHTASVEFVNDAWGGTTATDRNLFIDSIVAGGQRVGGGVELYSNGLRSFAIPAASTLAASAVLTNTALAHSVTLLPSI